MFRIIIVVSMLLVMGVVMLTPTNATAQAGMITIFSDWGGSDCNFTDFGSLVQVYFFHIFHGGAVASQFRLDVSTAGWMWLGDMWTFPAVIGNSINGVSLGYGACMPAPTYLGYANFLGTVSPPCTSIKIVADPRSWSGQIEGFDCASNPTFPSGGMGIVNNDGSCMCEYPLPVEQTTWGQVKALYE